MVRLKDVKCSFPMNGQDRLDHRDKQEYGHHRCVAASLMCGDWGADARLWPLKVVRAVRPHPRMGSALRGSSPCRERLKSRRGGEGSVAAALDELQEDDDGLWSVIAAKAEWGCGDVIVPAGRSAGVCFVEVGAA